MFLPYISHSKRIHGQSRTLSGNIFSNQYDKEAVSGNLPSATSDHVPQFLFVLSVLYGPPSSKSNIYERNWSKFNKKGFILDYFKKDWNDILNPNRNNIDLSFNNFLTNMNELLDKPAPYRKLSKYKLKLKTKPYITPAIKKSILIKNNLFKNCIKISELLIKQEEHLKYKYYKNLLCTTLKKGKQIYFEKFFQNNLNDIKNIWKGIRNFISLKQSPNSNIYLLPYNSETITTNIFYDYFSTISKKTKTKNNFSNKSFADFFHHPIDNFFFITAINSDEIKNRISKLNEYKYTGHNSSPTKILKLLKI